MDLTIELRLKKLMLFRLVMVTTLLFIAAYVEAVSETLLPVNPLYFLIGATYLLTVFYALALRSGEQQALTFTIPGPAPAGGMLIDVRTDVPDSVIMPEVMVPANATSVTVPVQGGKPGSGSLFFTSSAGESSVAVTVTAK